MLIFLVKPHPPLEILHKACPVPENYKYAWEPIALKLITFIINKLHPEIKTEVWHLIKEEDDDIFMEHIMKCKPDIVIFSEIDILVNEVSRLAKRVKRIDDKIITLVGGKQTSLLRKGDKFPFESIDFAFRGDGPNSISQFIDAQIKQTSLNEIEGFVHVDTKGYVDNEDSFSTRKYHDCIDNIEVHKIKVENYDLKDYIGEHQIQASILPDKIRTSPIYTGAGCPFNCKFCQSPYEYDRVTLFSTDRVAAEIAWLQKEYQVNNFFSLEPNLNLENLEQIYHSLDKIGIQYASVSGFVRAGDIIKHYKSGILGKVVEKGFRVVSIGLDVPLNQSNSADIYNKSFSYNEMLQCLNICEELGIIVLSTLFGNPELDSNEFINQLEFAKTLPLAEVDVRLAIALRNTDFFQMNEKYLIYHPDKNKKYFDQQNYRYQTIQYPNKIVPSETYQILNRFYDTFYFSEPHLDYVNRMKKKHPDTINYFERLYSKFDRGNE